MMSQIKRLLDIDDPNSLSARLRRQRFKFFKSLIQTVPRPIKLLDVGGTQQFWENMGFINETDIRFTLLNVHLVEVKYPNFTSVIGDATDLGQYEDGEFDIVFSNSVIEHVGDFTNQKRMAQEIRRVGKRYFVQTPNFYFPIEPHFLFPGFQWLPVSVRIWLLAHFKLGWHPKVEDVIAAREIVQSTRLLSKAEVIELFPDADIYQERIWLLTKSFIAYKWGP